jgi:hypothetical protein
MKTIMTKKANIQMLKDELAQTDKRLTKSNYYDMLDLNSTNYSYKLMT